VLGLELGLELELELGLVLEPVLPWHRHPLPGYPPRLLLTKNTTSTVSSLNLLYFPFYALIIPL
jgi:hypothetical protein